MAGGARVMRVARPLSMGIALGISTLAATSAALAQSAGRDSRDEAFEAVDPYTEGASAALDQAGYVSFGPFPWCEGVKSTDVAEVVGRACLWVETEHFKLGSTLETYKSRADRREEAKLQAELDRLRARFPKFRAPKGKLDPWLRLHLYAQRLEDARAEFLDRFGLVDADFATRGGAADRTRPYMGEGPHLGQPMKPTVLLTQKQSSLGRFARHYLQRDVDVSVRERLPGGTMFLGISAEGLARYGYELDSVLHCLVVAEATANFLAGFRATYATPFWLEQGLAHVASRAVDERWTTFAAGTTRFKDDDSYRWEPRVFGLVSNGFVPSWAAMNSWRAWTDVNAQGHMTVWSRVSWLMGRKDVDKRAFLLALTEPLPQTDAAQRIQIIVDRQSEVSKRVLGMEPAAIDEAWRSWVTKTYARK